MRICCRDSEPSRIDILCLAIKIRGEARTNVGETVQAA
jgi:hypothetical protein